MCTFQQAHSRPVYRKFMGTTPDNPRADYERRLANFDRARAAGLRGANPGILVGLNPDLGFELLALALHARHPRAHGMEVYLSVPRLRQIAGRGNQRGADDAFVRLVSILSLGMPDAKIVLITREPADIQRRLVTLVAVLSAGSAAVAPCTETGARFLSSRASSKSSTSARSKPFSASICTGDVDRELRPARRGVDSPRESVRVRRSFRGAGAPPRPATLRVARGHRSRSYRSSRCVGDWPCDASSSAGA
jgi:hypothetical protein